MRGELPMEVVDEKHEDPQLKFQHMKVSTPLTAEQRRANRAVEENAPGEPRSDRRSQNWPVMDGSVIINATPREAYANMVNIRGSDLTRQPLPSIHSELARLAPSQVLRQRTAGGGSQSTQQAQCWWSRKTTRSPGRFRQEKHRTTCAGSSESAGKVL